MTGPIIALKRRVNQEIREGYDAGWEAIPFLCECEAADCFEAVWLSGDEYDARRHPLARGHGPQVRDAA